MKFAIGLTILGLIPFIFFLSVIIFQIIYLEWLSNFLFKGDFADFLLNYAVVILSFLAGISWGLAIKFQDKKHKNINNFIFCNAVFVTISALISLMFYSIKLAYSYLIICYLWQLFVDIKINKFYQLNTSYIKIRKVASYVVVVVLLFAVYFVPAY